MADRGTPFFRRAVERARREPGFLGAALAEYQVRLGLDDAALAAELGCAEEHLADLALCRPPRAERFRADLEEIAAALPTPLVLADEVERTLDDSRRVMPYLQSGFGRRMRTEYVLVFRRSD